MGNGNVRKKKTSRWVTSFVICGLSFVLLYNFAQEVLTTLAYKEEIHEAEALLEQLKLEEDELMKQKDNLNDDEYIKRYARGKYMVGKEDEQVFSLPSNDE